MYCCIHASDNKNSENMRQSICVLIFGRLPPFIATIFTNDLFCCFDIPIIPMQLCLETLQFHSTCTLFNCANEFRSNTDLETMWCGNCMSAFFGPNFSRSLQVEEAVYFERRLAGLDATETGNERSQPKFQFTRLAMTLLGNQTGYCRGTGHLSDHSAECATPKLQPILDQSVEFSIQFGVQIGVQSKTSAYFGIGLRIALQNVRALKCPAEEMERN